MVFAQAGAGAGPARLAGARTRLLLEELEALREQRRRHQRHAASQVVEARAATDQLAQDQRRPALRKDLPLLTIGQNRP